MFGKEIIRDEKEFQVLAESLMRKIICDLGHTHLDSVRMALEVFSFHTNLLDTMPEYDKRFEEEFKSAEPARQVVLYKSLKFMADLHEMFYHGMVGVTEEYDKKNNGSLK